MNFKPTIEDLFKMEITTLSPKETKILVDRVISSEDICHALETCLSSTHLFYKVGDICDAVFTRSLSSLAISSILDIDVKVQIIPLSLLDNALDKALLYLKKEIDTRGYVDLRGRWANAIENGAKMLHSLALHSNIPKERYAEILQAIEVCLLKNGHIYTGQESEIFSQTVKAMIERGLGSTPLNGWLASLATSSTSYNGRKNTLNFLKTLYFVFKKDNENLKIRLNIYENILKLQELTDF
ncbi:MAG: DUF2785 domain-containing protein [Defluviitaleaceae bacterium]|nr:DUF2785 domain-containing protein [Defluviitaleaceae bacterium]